MEFIIRQQIITGEKLLKMMKVTNNRAGVEFLFN